MPLSAPAAHQAAVSARLASLAAPPPAQRRCCPCPRSFSRRPLPSSRSARTTRPTTCEWKGRVRACPACAAPAVILRRAAGDRACAACPALRSTLLCTPPPLQHCPRLPLPPHPSSLPRRCSASPPTIASPPPPRRRNRYLIGTRMRNTLMAVIYRKCLRLSNSALQVRTCAGAGASACASQPQGCGASSRRRRRRRSSSDVTPSPNFQLYLAASNYTHRRRARGAS